jgi:hypothetical protein
MFTELRTRTKELAASHSYLYELKGFMEEITSEFILKG